MPILTQKGGCGAHAANQMFNTVLSSLRTFDRYAGHPYYLLCLYQLLQFRAQIRTDRLVKGIILNLVFYGLAVMLSKPSLVASSTISCQRRRHLPARLPRSERMGQSTVMVSRYWSGTAAVTVCCAARGGNAVS